MSFVLEFSVYFLVLFLRLVYYLIRLRLDVYGSVHRNINRIEITNKMRPCSKIYYSNVS